MEKAGVFNVSNGSRKTVLGSSDCSDWVQDWPLRIFPLFNRLAPPMSTKGSIWKTDDPVGCSASNRSGIFVSNILMVVRNCSVGGRRNPHLVRLGIENERCGLYLDIQRGYHRIEDTVTFKYVN